MGSEEQVVHIRVRFRFRNRARLTMRQLARQQEAVKTRRKMVPMASEEQVACTHRLEPRLGQQVGRLRESPQQQLAALAAASTVTQEPSVQQQRGCAHSARARQWRCHLGRTSFLHKLLAVCI